MLTVATITFYFLCLGNPYVMTDMTNSTLANMLLRRSTSFASVSKRELNESVKLVRTWYFAEGGFREIIRAATPEFDKFYVNQASALF